MEYSKIKIVKVNAPERTTFDSLAVGDWYESNSYYGLCVKTSIDTAFSMTRREDCRSVIGNWACKPVNVQIKYR